MVFSDESDFVDRVKFFQENRDEIVPRGDRVYS